MLKIQFQNIIITVVFVIMLVSCHTTAKNNNETLKNSSHNKKHFKNLNASLSIPENIQEVEAPNSYTFVRPNEESVYVASIYHNQNSEQVKQTLVSSLNQNGYQLSLSSGFSMNSFGLNAADAQMEYGGVVYPGYIIVKEMPSANTYVLFGCAAHDSMKELVKSNLNQMALSLEIGYDSSTSNAGNNSGTHLNSVINYQNFLMNKVLINDKQSRDVISTDDYSASHGKWVTSEDVNKRRRFVLCNGGFGFYRYASTGWQITGDYMTVVLDKWSGLWKVISKDGKIYIYMEDERNGQYRTYEINEMTDKMIFIENRPYTIYDHTQSENECGRADGKVVVPD